MNKEAQAAHLKQIRDPAERERQALLYRVMDLEEAMKDIRQSDLGEVIEHFRKQLADHEDRIKKLENPPKVEPTYAPDERGGELLEPKPQKKRWFNFLLRP